MSAPSAELGLYLNSFTTRTMVGGWSLPPEPQTRTIPGPHISPAISLVATILAHHGSSLLTAVRAYRQAKSLPLVFP